MVLCLKGVDICLIFSIPLHFQCLLEIHVLGNCSTNITLNLTSVNVYVVQLFVSLSWRTDVGKNDRVKVIAFIILVGAISIPILLL